jgi:hypothetical protein
MADTPQQPPPPRDQETVLFRSPKFGVTVAHQYMPVYRPMFGPEYAFQGRCWRVYLPGPGDRAAVVWDIAGWDGGGDESKAQTAKVLEQFIQECMRALAALRGAQEPPLDPPPPADGGERH